MIDGLQKLNHLHLAVSNTELTWKNVRFVLITEYCSKKLNLYGLNYHLIV